MVLLSSLVGCVLVSSTLTSALYHRYLKQEFWFGTLPGALPGMLTAAHFDPEQPLRCHIATAMGGIWRLDFTRDVDVSRGDGPQIPSLVQEN